MNLPTSECFDRFVEQVVTEHGLEARVAPVSVRQLRTEGAAPVLTDADGVLHRPDRVVVATNHRLRVVPEGLGELVASRRAVCGEHADVADTPDGGRVVVVGGGISAAHLALGAVRRGAEVTLVSRRNLTVRRFDVHPSWLGPKKRGPFEAEPNPVVRQRMVVRARGGGTIPARFRRQLERAEESGRLRIVSRAGIVGADHVADQVELQLDRGRAVACDQVWLATGGSVDVACNPLLAELVGQHPNRIVDGLPVLQEDLCWPGTRVHLLGFAAALVLGPTAGNLVGQRRGAARIAAAIAGEDPGLADRTLTSRRGCQ